MPGGAGCPRWDRYGWKPPGTMVTWSEVMVPGEEGVDRVSGILPKPCREKDDCFGLVWAWPGLTLRTSRSEEVRELPPEDSGRLETGVATLLGRPGAPGAPGGEAGSPAFLARSLRAAANVDFEFAGDGLGPGSPG